ncbi:MAG: ROK family protein [Breznakia sp.]
MYLIGIDIGGTTTRISLGKEEKESLQIIKQSGVYRTMDFKPLDLISEVIAYIKENCANYGISSVGISCGGPLNSKLGIIQSPPNLPGWDDIKIVQKIEESLGIKTYLCNDANACALAEWKYGAGKGASNVIFLTFGTGMGAGLILNNRLYRGNQDMAGELGHIRLTNHGPVGYGKEGSIEGYCSGGGIEQMAATKLKEYKQSGKIEQDRKVDTTAKGIAKLVHQEEFASAVYEESSKALGSVLSGLIDLLNPEKIIVGSIYERNSKFMHPIVQKVIETEALLKSRTHCEVVPSILKEKIGDFAALSVASNGYYEDYI